MGVLENVQTVNLERQSVSIDAGGTLCPNLCGTKAGCGGGIHVRNWN